MRSSFCQLWLTCVNEQEAGKIANVLLEKRLVACVHQLPINSAYRWQGKIEHNREVLLQMDSRLDLFEKVEAVVKQLHSYKTPVLEATPIVKMSKKAEKWLREETDG